MDRYYFKKELTKRQHVGNSFCRYNDRLMLGGRGACCQLLMDDSGIGRIRYQLHHHWQNKLIYVLKRRQQIVSHYSKTIHIQQHKYTALSVVTIHATRVCFVYDCSVPVTTTRQYRSETLWITETSRTHRGTRSKNFDRKDTCPSLPLFFHLWVITWSIWRTHFIIWS